MGKPYRCRSGEEGEIADKYKAGLEDPASGAKKAAELPAAKKEEKT